MLDNQTLEQLRRLRLSGMAAAFAQQLEQPQLQALSFEERFSLLLDRELNLRENRRLNRLLQLARLRQQVMSNSGTVALLGPITISVASKMGINPMSLPAAIPFGPRLPSRCRSGIRQV